MNNVSFLRSHSPCLVTPFSSSELWPCFFDWQTATYGCPLVDLASIIDTCRQFPNTKLMQTLYYDTLLRCGVDQNEYSFEKLQKDYLLAKRWSFCYHIPVLGSAALGKRGVDETILQDLRNR